MQIPKSRFFFPDDVTIRVKLGDGAYGPVYDQPYTTMARVEPKRRKVVRPTGEEVVAAGVCFLPYDQTGVEVGSEIVYNGRKYTAIESIPVKSIRSVGYVEVLLG